MKDNKELPVSHICCASCRYNKGEDESGKLVCKRDNERRYASLVCDYWKEEERGDKKAL